MGRITQKVDDERCGKVSQVVFAISISIFKHRVFKIGRNQVELILVVKVDDGNIEATRGEMVLREGGKSAGVEIGTKARRWGN